MHDGDYFSIHRGKKYDLWDVLLSVCEYGDFCRVQGRGNIGNIAGGLSHLSAVVVKRACRIGIVADPRAAVSNALELP
jgi:hypothetical protein